MDPAYRTMTLDLTLVTNGNLVASEISEDPQGYADPEI